MDNYVLVERLGQGSFAIVWKARRKSDNRLVAVKQLKTAPSTWEECKRLPEIRAAATVRHPHIIALLEAVRHGSELFLVFEYADSDLYRCLGPDRGRFEESQVRWVMRQLLSALAAMHGARLVHCDVKPENLLLFARLGACGEPILKLCDLGQATSAGEVQSYVGTRWYRSPELLLGLGGAGCEIDLWAAGCFMAELLLLRPPFPGTDTRDMLFRICSALGAPEDGYHLSERLMQASGLRFAPCAAEGPLWFELASSGASSSAVELVRLLLRYDQNSRMPAARAVHATFFTASGAAEVAVTLSEERGRMRSIEGFQRSRDEAKAVERKIQAKSGARPAQQGNATGFGFVAGGGINAGGGLGVAGGVAPIGTSVGAPAQGQAALLQTQATPFPNSGSLISQVGAANGPPTGASSMSAVDFGGVMRRQHSEKSGLPTMSAATRRAVQERRAYRRDMAPSMNMAPSASTNMAPSASTTGVMLPGLQHHPSSSNTDFWEAAPREQWTGIGTTQSLDSRASGSSPSVSPKAPGKGRLAGVHSDESGTEAGVGGDDDEELADLFWRQVEHSRASPPPPPPVVDTLTSSTRRVGYAGGSHLKAGYVSESNAFPSAVRAETGVHTVHVVSAPTPSWGIPPAPRNPSPPAETEYQSAGRENVLAGGLDARPRRPNRPGGGSSAGSRSNDAYDREAQPLRGTPVVCAVAGSVSCGNAGPVGGSGATGSSDHPESLDPVDLLEALGTSPPAGNGTSTASASFFGTDNGPMPRPASFDDPSGHYPGHHQAHHHGHLQSHITGGYVTNASRGITAMRGSSTAIVAPTRQAPGTAFMNSGIT